MKKRPKEPFVPVERHETIRRQIMDILAEKILSAKEISGQVRIPEKEVYEHLEHIRKTINKKEQNLTVTPSECIKCGFLFKKRERQKTRQMSCLPQ